MIPPDRSIARQGPLQIGLQAICLVPGGGWKRVADRDLGDVRLNPQDERRGTGLDEIKRGVASGGVAEAYAGARAFRGPPDPQQTHLLALPVDRLVKRAVDVEKRPRYRAPQELIGLELHADRADIPGREEHQ